MRKMKFTLVAAMLLMVTVASAQMNLGIKGGVNMSNFYGDEVTDKNMKIGFNIGLAADYDFAPNSAIQSGLFFTTKGLQIEAADGKLKYTTNLMYIQLPVHYAYKIDVTPGTRVVLHAGPYAAYGVGGGRKATLGSLGEIKSDKVFGDGVLQYKPFDAGLGFGVGAELGQIMLDLGLDYGLTNISNTKSGDVKNQNAYLSIGYKF